jgi:hypothetical protein
MSCFPRRFACLLCLLFVLSGIPAPSRDNPPDLRLGVASHAFDHLGSIGDQAAAAVASGANIIYISGVGALGYGGLPPVEEFTRARGHVAAYVRSAKSSGIRLAIGYVCATSIVKLRDFDRNWPEDLRSQVKTPASDWLQVDRSGKPLKSWYGGDYEAACMNNPDWRAYERFIVSQQFEAGCDGIFFDNPSVHRDGCYCQHCMRAFKEFVEQFHKGSPGRVPRPAVPDLISPAATIQEVRAYATGHPELFLRFRCTIARDFFAHIRTYARSINPNALITANSSLNSADALFSQCRGFAYNIYEMSKAEDYVVVEDMSSQPRTLPSGQTIEYGPTYKQLVAISHGKPLVAVTIADADYHTPPNLVRLAMAEAVANGGSYLSWPTWPENERDRMISTIRPQSDFLRRHVDHLNSSRSRADVVVFLPFREWMQTDQCIGSTLAAGLSKANIQYVVICEDQLRDRRAFGDLADAKILLVGSRGDLTKAEREATHSFLRKGTIIEAREKPGPKSVFRSDWLKDVRAALPNPSLQLEGPTTLRAVVRDQQKRTIVHLLNLNVQKLSSFTDKITPAMEVRLTVRVPFKRVHSVKVLTADAEGSWGSLEFQIGHTMSGSIISTVVPRTEIASLIMIE